MAKTITINQLKRAIKTAPDEVRAEGQKFLQRGLSEYRRVVTSSSPWRVGQSGGGAPKASNNLRERHKTKISGLRGTFGVSERDVRYAGYVHQGTSRMKRRPWLIYARDKAEKKVEKHYRTFMDEILQHIAT